MFPRRPRTCCSFSAASRPSKRWRTKWLTPATPAPGCGLGSGGLAQVGLDVDLIELLGLEPPLAVLQVQAGREEERE